MGIWYATREDVKSALDYKETARSNALVDLAIESASRKVEEMTHRIFYPTIGTKYVNWPNKYGYSWRVWAQGYDILSVTSLVSGGITIPSGDYFLEPVNQGPPFNRVEIDLSSRSWFHATATPQRQVAITGVFGYCDDTAPAGDLASAISSTTATTCTVTNSAAVGVGDLIKVDDEYMAVIEKSLVDTGEDCSDLTAMQNSVTITGVTAGFIFPGEVLTVDSERLLVVDVAGETLTVKRAYDGTVLAAHTGSPGIYAPRGLALRRAQAGTAAAAHSTAAPVVKNVPPGPVAELVTAYALDALEQKQSGYARTVGSGEYIRNATGAGLASLANLVDARYTRRRFGAV